MRIVRLLEVLEGEPVETAGLVGLVAIIGEAALTLEDDPFRPLVPGLVGGGESQVEASIRLLLATRIHEDGRVVLGRER